MIEKRRYKRLPVSIKLEISELFKQDNVKVTQIDAPIEVIDISKTGLAFRTASVLPLNYYFNAKITLGKEDSSLFTVVKIIRTSPTSNNLSIYGCELIGLAPVFSYIFEDYEKVIESQNL